MAISRENKSNCLRFGIRKETLYTPAQFKEQCYSYPNDTGHFRVKEIKSYSVFEKFPKLCNPAIRRTAKS